MSLKNIDNLKNIVCMIITGILFVGLIVSIIFLVKCLRDKHSRTATSSVATKLKSQLQQLNTQIAAVATSTVDSKTQCVTQETFDTIKSLFKQSQKLQTSIKTALFNKADTKFLTEGVGKLLAKLLSLQRLKLCSDFCTGGTSYNSDDNNCDSSPDTFKTSLSALQKQTDALTIITPNVTPSTPVTPAPADPSSTPVTPAPAGSIKSTSYANTCG